MEDIWAPLSPRIVMNGVSIQNLQEADIACLALDPLYTTS